MFANTYNLLDACVGSQAGLALCRYDLGDQGRNFGCFLDVRCLTDVHERIVYVIRVSF